MTQLLPHQIGVALYIQLVLNKNKLNNVWMGHVTPEVQRKTLLFALKLIRNSDICWKELQGQLGSVLDDSDISTLVKEFHKLQDTEELMEAMKSFELLLDPPNKVQSSSDIQSGSVTRSSIIGVFLRKVILEFKKMSFDTVNALCQSLSEYLNLSQGLETNEEGNFSFNSKLNIDMNTSDMSCMEESLLENEKENITCLPHHPKFEYRPINSASNKEQILLSRNQVMRFITEQVRFVENFDSLALPPDKLQEKILKIRQLYPDIKEVYYLSFMNYLRVLETNKAAISLQLYFDYKEFGGKPHESDISELEKHQLKFKAFRYCALNLGIMHCHHGNYKQAMISLEECIQIAQQTNDQKCLNNAMFWLSIIKEETNEPGEGSTHLKAFVSDTAKKIMDAENNMNLKEIDYLGLLRYTQLQAFKGLITPSKGLAIISQIVSDLKVSNCAQLTRSSLLDFYGFKHAAIVNCQIPLQNMVLNDLSISGRCMIKSKLLAIALCQLSSLLMAENHFEMASAILQFARKQFPVYSSFQKMVMLAELKIEFDNYVGLRDLNQAHTISKSVARIDGLEGKYMNAALNLLQGNVTSASKDATALLASMEKKKSSVTKTPMLKVKILILLIESKFVSKDMNGALNLIFKLKDFVQTCCMYGMQLDASICLIRYQLQLGLVSKAKEVLDKTLYQALAFGTFSQKGILFYLKAKCLVQSTEKDESNKLSLLEEAKVMLEKSMEYFSDTHLDARKKDILLEQAIVAHKMRNFTERNRISSLFRSLHEKLEGLMPVMMF